MPERNIEGKQDQLDDYLGTQLDSLQAQINAQRTKIDQLNTRLTSHLNDKQGHEQKVGLEGSDLDV